MSDSSTENDGRLVPDEKLPDDLQPKKNPLARDPDDLDSGAEESTDPGPSTDSLPDAGQPG